MFFITRTLPAIKIPGMCVIRLKLRIEVDDSGVIQVIPIISIDNHMAIFRRWIESVEGEEEMRLEEEREVIDLTGDE